MHWFVIIISLLALYSLVMTGLWWRQKKHNDNDEPLSQRVQKKPLTDQFEDPIMQKANEAQSMIQTFQKFVPRQFVDHFAMGGAESLKLGYAHEDEVAVMFCDIRGFTGLSERMSPQQLMNFLNSYFLRMNAPIHDNGGFIDKFIGDAIMALFDHPTGTPASKASDAVKAALDLQKALRLYNHHRANSGYEPIQHGIGLHYGPVVLGTVGSDDRMDTTVIGDTVNITQRIETLADYFGSSILASQLLVDEASTHMEFSYRHIDTVYLKGKSTSVDICEIYHHLPQYEIDAKNATQSVIQEGIALRNAKDFKRATALFADAKVRFADDKVIEHHLKTCEHLSYAPHWDGKVSL